MSNDAGPAGDRTRAGQDEADGDVSRRRLLVTGAAGWTAVGVAGCCDPPDTAGEGTDTPTATPTTVTTSTTTTDTSDDGTPGDGETPTATPTPTPTPSPTGTSCTQASLFAVGQQIGFLAGVYDRMSGEPMGPEAVASVRLAFDADGLEDREMQWTGDHEGEAADKWGVAADTDGLDPGTYRYEVVVTHGGPDGGEERASDTFQLSAY